MADALSIRLPKELRRQLQRASKREKRPASEITREALRRYLAVQEFRALRRQTVPLAEARGIFTDEDVFRLVS